VTVDGFFEWHKAPGAGRQPHYFTRSDGQPLTIAGLYEFWRDPRRADDPTAWMRSCTIITTRASQDMDGVHDRMPAVLDQDVLDVWLEPEGADPHELKTLLSSPKAGTLVHHRVDPRVGNVKNDDPTLIEQWKRKDPPVQPSLLGDGDG